MSPRPRHFARSLFAVRAPCGARIPTLAVPAYLAKDTTCRRCLRCLRLRRGKAVRR